MTVALRAWVAQTEAIARSATDPLGGLASGLVSGLSAGASFDALDDFSQRNCGALVFRS